MWSCQKDSWIPILYRNVVVTQSNCWTQISEYSVLGFCSFGGSQDTPITPLIAVDILMA